MLAKPVGTLPEGPQWAARIDLTQIVTQVTLAALCSYRYRFSRL